MVPPPSVSSVPLNGPVSARPASGSVSVSVGRPSSLTHTHHATHANANANANANDSADGNAHANANTHAAQPNDAPNATSEQARYEQQQQQQQQLAALYMQLLAQQQLSMTLPNEQYYSQQQYHPQPQYLHPQHPTQQLQLLPHLFISSPGVGAAGGAAGSVSLPATPTNGFYSPGEATHHDMPNAYDQTNAIMVQQRHQANMTPNTHHAPLTLNYAPATSQSQPHPHSPPYFRSSPGEHHLHSAARLSSAAPPTHTGPHGDPTHSLHPTSSPPPPPAAPTTPPLQAGFALNGTRPSTHLTPHPTPLAVQPFVGGVGSVLLVENLDPLPLVQRYPGHQLPLVQLSPDHLFTCFGVYGDVVRVKLFFTPYRHPPIAMTMRATNMRPQSATPSYASTSTSPTASSSPNTAAAGTPSPTGSDQNNEDGTPTPTESYHSHALVQFMSKEQASLARDHLVGVRILGPHSSPMKISVSHLANIHYSGRATAEPGVITKDYAHHAGHRFKYIMCKNSRHISAPCSALHLSGLASDVRDDDLRHFFTGVFDRTLGVAFATDSNPPAPLIRSINLFGSEGRKMAFIVFDSIDAAVIGLVFGHNVKLKGKYMRITYSHAKEHQANHNNASAHNHNHAHLAHHHTHQATTASATAALNRTHAPAPQLTIMPANQFHVPPHDSQYGPLSASGYGLPSYPFGSYPLSSSADVLLALQSQLSSLSLVSGPLSVPVHVPVSVPMAVPMPMATPANNTNGYINMHTTSARHKSTNGNTNHTRQ